MLFQPPMACRIEQSSDSHHRVGPESTHIAQSVTNLALQDVVDDGDWIVEVGEEVRDGAAHRCRRDLHVGACDRAEHCMVDCAIERIHGSIDTLKSIAGIRFSGGQRGAAAERQYQRDRREQMKSIELHKASEPSASTRWKS